MLSMFSNAFAALASGFSGSDSKLTFILFWDDIKCPKELIK